MNIDISIKKSKPPEKDNPKLIASGDERVDLSVKAGGIRVPILDHAETGEKNCESVLIKVYVVSPYGTTSTVAIKSYLQISQYRALMFSVLFQFVRFWIPFVRNRVKF